MNEPLSGPHALSVLHVVSSVNSGTGGPALSVPGLARALARRGVRGGIASLDYADFGAPVEVEGVNNIHLTPSALGRRLRGWSPALGAAIVEATSQCVDVIHSHGAWMYPGIYARRASVRLGIPLVVSPRGMLDSWSLRHGAVRKAVAARVYERKNLRRASLFHATSEMEADSIRQYGLKQPIAIVPNGVEIPAEAAEYPRRLLELQFPPLHGRRWLLFMGRLHPKKGLDMLIGAWRTLQSQFPDWHLLVAGPDQVGLRSSLEAMVADAGALRESITYTGMLDGAAKHSALANADVFVLPTRSENFGIAVAEALAHGTPVVTTTAAPWSDLTAVDCGWWVEPNQFAIANALAEAMSRTSSQLADQGRRGRQMVTEKYSWDGAAARMIAAYRWILDGGEKPNWVLEA